MPFQLTPAKKAKLEAVLNHFSSYQKSFYLELKNFAAFPPRVIYIDVVPNQQLQTLQQELQGVLQSQMNLFQTNYKNQAFHPHVTIAFRDLKKTTFHVAWAHYSKQNFHSEIRIDALAVLKHQESCWQLHKSFEFFQS